MKKILFFVYLLIINVQIIFSQTPSNCNVPNELLQFYATDAKALALKWVFSSQSPYKDSIDIPLTYQDTIMNGLAAIYNLNTQLDADLVFNKHCIHADLSNQGVYYSIIIKVDTNVAWTSNWKNMQTTTGITSIDNLISNYGFLITNYFKHLDYAVLTTTNTINTFAFCDSLKFFNGIISASPSANAGEKNDITYNKYNNLQEYKFKLAWGDCMSGCMYHYTWKYLVDNNCNVYLSTDSIYNSNEPLPEPVNCNLITSTDNNKLSETKIYPNPIENSFSVCSNEINDFTYTITDITGKKVFSSKNIINDIIDINFLKAGVYLIRIQNNNMILIKKIIKQ